MCAYRAVVFDFDLTLADSGDGFWECHRFAAEGLGLEPPAPEAVRRMIGIPLTIVFGMLYPGADAEIVGPYVERYQARADEVMTELTLMLPGAEETVRTLMGRGLKLGILSQKLRFRVEDVLRREGLLVCFEAVFGAEDVPAFKPDPRGLTLLVERFAVAPEETLFAGDTVIDAETAARAGVPFAGVLTGATGADEFAAWPYETLLPSVADLPSFMESCGSASDSLQPKGRGLTQSRD